MNFWNNLHKRKIGSTLSTEEIIQRYNGFEGELLQMALHKKDLARLETLFDPDKNLLLYVFSDSEIFEKKDVQNLSLVGHEYGVCEEGCTIFSSIFNEILFGINSNLRQFYESLNGNLLFPDYELALNYAKVHKQLHQQGKDIECPSNMKVYQIWKPIFI